MRLIWAVIPLVIFSIIGIQESFAESESLTVAARSYEQTEIYLNAGDELEFSIQVQGGSNDDINFIIGIPGQDVIEGRVVVSHSDKFTAPTSGTYVFTFDNTISTLSNKSVLFSYEITKNIYYVYVDKLPDYAINYAGDAVYIATEFWKETLPQKQFYIAENENDVDIIIKWVRDFGGFNEHIGYQYVKLVEVGLGDSNCYGNWKEYDSTYLTNIIAHEIGHSMGFKHNDNPESIMYPTINPSLQVYSSPCVSPQSEPQQTTQTPTSSGGGCLIATATYGSELVPQVQKLRELRDNSLLQTESGTNFMNYFNDFYYSFSPIIADYERENPVFKEMVKIAITPMISSLSILNYVDMGSEISVLGYGISLIILNLGMYVGIPAIVIIGIRKRI